MTRLRSIFTYLSVIVFGTLLALICVEVTLRTVDYSTPIFRQPEHELGWTLQPGLSGWHRKENLSFLTINSAGRNDRGFSIAKPEGTVRVAVLGDSFTFAAEVAREKNFCSVLEEIMSDTLRSTNRRSEVLNFGVVGYGTSQQYLQLQRDVLAYKPDLIILVMYLGNDVSDNHPELAESIKALRVYFRVENEKLVRDPTYPRPSSLKKNSLMVKAVNSLRLFQLLNQIRLRAFGEKHMHESRVPKRGDGVLREPEGAWKEAWERTEAILTSIARTASDKDIPFLLVTAPDPIVVHPRSQVINEFKQTLGVNDLTYPERRLSEFAARANIEIFHLSEPLRIIAQTNGIYLHGFTGQEGKGHWNAVGHSHVARAIAHHVIKQLEKRGRYLYSIDTGTVSFIKASPERSPLSACSPF